MRVLIVFIILLCSLTKSLSISVGFKINGKPDSTLIIGELSDFASSVQITSILNQLTALKNRYNSLHSGQMINLKIGKKLKSSKSLSLYEIDSTGLLKFINSQIKVGEGKNYAIQTYLTVYNFPSLIISKSESLQAELQISLDDSVMIDLHDLFGVNLQVTHSCSPVLEYDEIYGDGQGTSSRLLRSQNSESNCVHRCCNIM